ncbi:ABC transporter permease [Urbifossiella limnaea]|uniref:ABC-2 family transporter protein n=1 Tax=Urbifossiella limnaea TaxID=2528023 RepID=A0A517XUA2_9BACT|nr:ABC transporter permease [Urbifossiella limnaea]QDU21091.1 ABC-2 family transporter protein [Urbifossiella limnaea]
MRPYVIHALVTKEAQRHVANRGGIVLAVLLVASAVLLSVFAPEETASGTGMVGGVHHCFVEFDRSTPLVKHLQDNKPTDLKVQFRELANADTINAVIVYPPGTGAIQLRQDTLAPERRPAVKADIWHPEGDPLALAPYEAWFWKETRRYFAAEARKTLPGADVPADPDFAAGGTWLVTEAHVRLQERVEAARGTDEARPLIPDLVIDRKGLGGKVLDFRAAIATGMVVFALYFSCVYLLPTLNCEERERGVLLAQALSPASPAEIVAAKFFFYPTAGIILAAIIAGVYKVAILQSLFFWLALFAVAGGFLGIGMTVATLAKTQRAAFLGGMCYLLSVSMLLLICATNGIPFLPYLAVEYHGPRILHASLAGEVHSGHWGHLGGAILLAVIWLTAAGWLFRRRGWQ